MPIQVLDYTGSIKTTFAPSVSIDYTPTLTDITLGAGGTMSGRFIQTGAIVYYTVTITLGTDPDPNPYFGAIPRYSLPVPAISKYATTMSTYGFAFNGTTTSYDIRVVNADPTTDTVLIAYGGNPNNIPIDDTHPFNWVSGSFLTFGGVYFAA